MRTPQKYYGKGDPLKGGSIKVKARKIIPKKVLKKTRNVRRKRFRLEGTASAEIMSNPDPGHVVGDNLSAEIIIAETDKAGPTLVTPGSSTHNIQQRNLRGNVFCYIKLSIRSVRDSQESRS